MAKIIHDKKNGYSMGYGFLIFGSKEDAEKSLTILSGQTMPKSNKKFKLNHAIFNNRNKENEFSVYVCDLSPTVSSEQLVSFFKAKYKSVISGKIIIDPMTKISKRYGFVTFTDEKEKEKAMTEMNGKILNGQAIKTGNATHKKFDKYKAKMMNKLQQNLFIQQQYQQFYNNQYFLANNYYASLLNPFFQQQMYSQLEEYLNNTDEASERNDLSSINFNNIDGKDDNC